MNAGMQGLLRETDPDLFPVDRGLHKEIFFVEIIT